MDRRAFLQAVSLFGVLSQIRIAGAATKLVVVVHLDNPVQKLGPGEIEALFTTRKLDWPGGKRVVPFNFPPHHPLREAFDRDALHLSADEAARYWIDRRVRGGHAPPRQVTDVHTMLRVVAALDTAIGYARKEDVTSDVRIVAEI
jgi:hypothetical protein